MTAALTLLTGTVSLPNGETPSHGRVKFVYSGWGKNGDNIFVPGPVETVLSSEGALVGCYLQSTVTLDGLVLCSATITYYSWVSGGEVTVSVPSFAVPATGPVSWATLLATPAPNPTVPDALAQALAALADTQIAAGVASAHADASAESAYQAGLYAAEAAGTVSDVAINVLHLGQSNAQASAGAFSPYWPNNPRTKTAVYGSGLVATSTLQGDAPFNADGSLNPGAVMADEIAKAKGWSVNVYPSYQGATPISAWAGSMGLTVVDVAFDAGSGTAFAYGATITWNDGLDGPAYVLRVTDSGATGTMTLAMAVGKRLFDNTAIVGSAGKTANINGDPVETAFWDATHFFRLGSSAGGNLVPGDVISWTGGTAQVLFATYQTAAVCSVVVRILTGVYPANLTAVTATGGKSAAVGANPIKFNLRWTVTCAYDGGNVATITTGAPVTWTVGGVASTGILTDATNGTTGNVWIEVLTGYEPINNTVLTCGSKTMVVNGALARDNRPKWNEIQDLIQQNTLAQFDAVVMNHGEAAYDWTDSEYKAALQFVYDRAKLLGTGADAARFMPYVLGLPYTGPKSGQQAFRAETIESFAYDNSGWAKTAPSRGLEGRDDTPGPTGIINHFTNAGYLELGKRMARSLLDLLSGSATQTDIVLDKMRLPGAVNAPGGFGSRLWEPTNTIEASTTLLIANKAYLNQLYALKGTITITLDGDANKALGDGGVGFEFYTSLAGDTITFDGDGRLCVLMGGDGSTASTITVAGAGRGRVSYQGSRWVIEFTLLADLKRRAQADNSADANASVSVSNGWFIRFTGALTQNRTVSLTQTGVVSGDRIRVVNATSGAFSLTVRDNVATGNSRVTATGNAVDFVHNGTAWQLAGYMPL